MGEVMSDKPAGDAKAISEMSFEEALKALEGVVEALEGGQVPLETSLDLYERGERLRKHCEDRLKAAELRVERIVTGADGEATGTTPFEAQ
jgi:exodeoxyribonuclease VII small subunit